MCALLKRKILMSHSVQTITLTIVVNIYKLMSMNFLPETLLIKDMNKIRRLSDIQAILQ